MGGSGLTAGSHGYRAGVAGPAFTLTGPLDLVRTAGAVRLGPYDPTVRLSPSELWWATRTPEGPGTVHGWISRGDVHAEAWGTGARWLEAQLPDLLGQRDDVTGFRPHHPAVERAWHRHRGVRVARSGVVLPALVAAVLGQRVTAEEAMRGWRALCRELGGPAPGPPPIAGDGGRGLLLPPDPSALAGRPSWWYHRLGIERHRADTLRRVGRHAARVQEAAGMALPQAWARLQAVPGVGPWTAAKVAGSALGDADAVPVGDYHLPSLVAWALAGEPRADDNRMLDLLAPYAGHRGRVLHLLLADGVHAPRYGPGRRLLPIARW